MLAFVRALFALCITIFLVGGPAVSSLETSTAELSRQDSVSGSPTDPATLFRRNTSQHHKFVSVPLGPTQEDFVLPDAPVGEVAVLHPSESVVALVTESRHAAPVRGPPCAHA
jgi:hypothetical protein